MFVFLGPHLSEVRSETGMSKWHVFQVAKSGLSKPGWGLMKVSEIRMGTCFIEILHEWRKIKVHLVSTNRRRRPDWVLQRRPCGSSPGSQGLLVPGGLDKGSCSSSWVWIIDWFKPACNQRLKKVDSSWFFRWHCSHVNILGLFLIFSYFSGSIFFHTRYEPNHRTPDWDHQGPALSLREVLDWWCWFRITHWCPNPESMQHSLKTKSCKPAVFQSKCLL